MADVQHWSLKLWDLEYESESEASEDVEDDHVCNRRDQEERAVGGTGGSDRSRSTPTVSPSLLVRWSRLR